MDCFVVWGPTGRRLAAASPAKSNRKQINEVAHRERRGRCRLAREPVRAIPEDSSKSPFEDGEDDASEAEAQDMQGIEELSRRMLQTCIDDVAMYAVYRTDSGDESESGDETGRLPGVGSGDSKSSSENGGKSTARGWPLKSVDQASDIEDEDEDDEDEEDEDELEDDSIFEGEAAGFGGVFFPSQNAMAVDGGSRMDLGKFQKLVQALPRLEMELETLTAKSEEQFRLLEQSQKQYLNVYRANRKYEKIVLVAGCSCSFLCGAGIGRVGDGWMGGLVDIALGLSIFALTLLLVEWQDR